MTITALTIKMTDFDLSQIDGQEEEHVSIVSESISPGKATYSMKVEHLCSIVYCLNAAQSFVAVVTKSSRVRLPLYSCLSHYGEVMEAAQSLGAPSVDHSTVNDILDIRDSIKGG